MPLGVNAIDLAEKLHSTINIFRHPCQCGIIVVRCGITVVHPSHFSFLRLKYLVFGTAFHIITCEIVIKHKRETESPQESSPHICGPSQSIWRDLWPFRHLIRVMRKHDLTNKHCKNCECCPVPQLTVRLQRLSWIQVLNYQWVGIG